MRLHVEEDKKPMKAADYLMKRLKEKSTWAGIGTIAALAGLKIDPDQLSVIGGAVIALISVFEIFRKEKK